MKRNIVFYILGLVLAVISGCSDAPTAASTMETDEKIVDVDVFAAEACQFKSERWIAGVVLPAKRAVIGTRVNGSVKNLHVRAGDFVEKGALLMEIDSRDLASGINAALFQRDTALAAWRQAERDLERARRLYDQELIAKVRVEEAELHEQYAKSILAGAEAHLASLETHMDYARIKAPFSGVVSDVMVEFGSFAGPGLPLMILEDRSRLEVRASIDEKTMLTMKEGDAADVYLPGLQKTVAAVIEAFIPALEAPGTGSSMRLLLKDPPAEARPAMVAHIRTFSGEKPLDAVVIPETALLVQGQMQGVFVVKNVDGALRTRLRWVHSTGPAPGITGYIVVNRGLNPGEIVVVGDIIGTLKDDQRVRSSAGQES